MTEREKVVGHLQILRTWCAVNPDFDMGLSAEDCVKAVEWLDNALALLKAQEPVEPVVDIDTWKCGNCGHTLEHQQLLGDNVLLHEQYNFCPECGRAVKWK